MGVFRKTFHSETLPNNFQHFPTTGSQQPYTSCAVLEMCSLTYTMKSFLPISLHEVSVPCLLTPPPAVGRSSEHPALAQLHSAVPPSSCSTLMLWACCDTALQEADASSLYTARGQ